LARRAVRWAGWVTRRGRRLRWFASQPQAWQAGHAARAQTAPPDPAPTGPAVIDWRGPHQVGITTPQPAAGLVVAFDLLAPDRAALEELFRTLTERVAYLTGGHAAPQADDPRLPPPESGLMGAEVNADALTITVSVGASLFEDARYDLAAARPARLIRMERFFNDAIDADQAHGDVLIQFCAESDLSVIYALRAIIKATGHLMAPRWQLAGFLRTGGTGTPRNLFGFRDGTANPDARDPKVMDALVWTPPGAPDEPAWTAGGSYQVVRIIRQLVERWDRTPLGEQERIFGRHRLSGAPQGGRHEFDAPDFSHPAMPVDAHIRLANPRTPETAKNRILRRGYNYSRGVTRSGQLDMGLLFICFQADLDQGFRTVQARLSGEPLDEYVKPTGGGYFFAPPGVAGQGRFLGDGMLGLA
jgi:deferrochelatase/peroxidase EfeB